MWFSLTGPVNRGNKENIEVEIKSGTSRREIGNILKEKKLIRSTLMFNVYIRLNSVNSLKASTYLFNQSMSLGDIVSELEKGSTYNPNLVVLTLKEGKRITDYAKLISEKTNSSYDEVIAIFKDREYAKELVNEYWFLTDKILDSNIYYPLEGYLFPDTYHFENKDVEVKEIIDKVLEETDNKLSEYRDELSKDPHYYMTMASVVELEGTNTRTPQNPDEVTFAPIIKKEDEKLDFSKTEREVYNKIRGLNAFPGAYTIFEGKRMKVWESRQSEDYFPENLDGEIVKIYKDGIGVKVSNGVIVFTVIQPEGKGKMQASAYLNGVKENIIGKVFE